VITGSAAGMLAMLPEPGSYASIVKLITHVALILAWVWLCVWVNKDVEYVRTNGLQWRLIVLCGALLGILMWWLIPIFIVGLLMYLVAVGGSIGVYIYHRNSMVGVAAKILTSQHLKGVLKGLSGGDRKTVPQLVKFLNEDKKVVPLPEQDPDALERYRLAQDLIYDAIWRRAIEIKVTTSGNQGKVAYQIDGVLTPRPGMERENADRVLLFIKQIAGLDLEDHRKPQQGEFTASTIDPVTGRNSAQEVEVRTAGSTTGEQLTLRLLTSDKQLRTEDLGMREDQVKVWNEVLAKPGGLVIVSSPPANGLTTTLYAALRHHDAFTQNIQTFEKQTKFDLEVITQHTYDPSKGISYARSIQTVLHRDPDVLMVAEIPDKETAIQIARGVAQNKKMYIGIQANDTFEALERWMRLQEDPKSAGNGILAITSQRLIRKLCTVCRVPYKPDADLLRRANIPAEKAKQVYRARTEPQVDKNGKPIICPNCQGSGYYGRTAIFELLLITPDITALIRKEAPMADIKAACRKRGMLYMQEEALGRFVDGTTSIQEVLRATKAEPLK
jgi:type II secretory ATPase GspE/PulE/Tfp pilus assembly ATPase PilB-like protein